VTPSLRDVGRVAFAPVAIGQVGTGHIVGGWPVRSPEGYARVS
jgi:hypothetical protein